MSPPDRPKGEFPSAQREASPMSEPRAIRLIVGLGNIGAEYAATRHNAGFRFADAVAGRAGAQFSHERKFQGEVARVRSAGSAGARELWLLKPSTYYNRSGNAVVALALYYKILPDEILVAHDEVDLPPGSAKMKRGGGAAGNNGVKDISAKLATPEFWRLRFGVGHPRTLGFTQDVADFVLHPPSREHQQALDTAMERALDCVPALVEGQFERAMMKLHARA
jgi:PTH1 family peptidyl-tRNA hydrolase